MVIIVPSMKLFDARRPSVVKAVSITELGLIRAAAPPFSVKSSVRRLT